MLVVLDVQLSMELSEDLFELLSKLNCRLKFNLTGCISSVFNENGTDGLIPVEVKGCKLF